MPWSPVSGIPGLSVARDRSTAPGVDPRQPEPSPLVEPQRIDVVVGRDQPQPASPGRLRDPPRGRDQRGPDARPLASGVQRQHLHRPPAQHPRQDAGQLAVDLGDQRRMPSRVLELAQPRHHVRVVRGQERVDGRPIGRVGRPDGRVERSAVGIEQPRDPEALDDDERVVGDREARVPEPLANLVDEAVPVVLVRDPEGRGVGVALALVDRVLVGHVGQPDHLRPHVLDHRQRPLVGVEQDRDVARLLHRFALDLVVGQQVRRHDLPAADRQRRQLVAQRSRRREPPPDGLARHRSAGRGDFGHAALRDRAHLRPSLLGP